jgi:hypothetical protein
MITVVLNAALRFVGQRLNGMRIRTEGICCRLREVPQDYLGFHAFHGLIIPQGGKAACLLPLREQRHPHGTSTGYARGMGSQDPLDPGNLQSRAFYYAFIENGGRPGGRRWSGVGCGWAAVLVALLVVLIAWITTP